MTTEQAIKLLHRLQDEQFDGPHGDERREALEMAVKALEGDGDTISRQQAIEALNDEYHGMISDESMKIYQIINWISALPSAQPEVLACGSGELVQESGDLVKELVKDCISRKMAIDGILMFMPVELGKGASMAEQVNYSAWKTAISCAESYVRTMPSAQPEWNNHTVACLLADMFGDACACNYNGIDEWLPGKCELLDSCPHPVGVACWEQFLKHKAERRTDGRCGL